MIPIYVQFEISNEQYAGVFNKIEKKTNKLLVQSATSEYLTTCVADIGRTRSGDLALGIANRSTANDYANATNEEGHSMLVLPIDDVDIYKKRDRLIVKVNL